MSTPASPSAHGFEIVSRSLLHQWDRAVLEQVEMATPNGSTATRYVISGPGAVSIVPLLNDGNTIALVRQYRVALDAFVLEIPAGTRDVEGEAVEVTAARELREEVGYVARSLTMLSEFYSSPGSSNHHHSLFLAEGLTQVEREAHGAEEEHMTVEHIRISEISQLIASGMIVDAKTIIGLLLVRDWLNSRT